MVLAAGKSLVFFFREECYCRPRSLGRGDGGGGEGWQMGVLWTNSAPCPPCLALGWISAGSGPVLLAVPPGGLERGSGDRQKQNGSKPAMCTELLLAQGLHLIPSTPAL